MRDKNQNRKRNNWEEIFTFNIVMDKRWLRLNNAVFLFMGTMQLLLLHLNLLDQERLN